MKHILIGLCLAILTTSSLAKSSKHETLSGPAKDFTLKSNKGKNIKLSELRGRVVMLNFWASWCGPCRQEMPLLEKLSQRYEPAGFTLLGINVDSDKAAADRILEEIPVSFNVLYDPENTVSETYKVDVMPSTILVDCDGNLNYLHRGYVPGDEKAYKSRIKKLLRSCE